MAGANLGERGVAPAVVTGIDYITPLGSSTLPALIWIFVRLRKIVAASKPYGNLTMEASDRPTTRIDNRYRQAGHGRKRRALRLGCVHPQASPRVPFDQLKREPARLDRRIIFRHRLYLLDRLSIKDKDAAQFTVPGHWPRDD